MRANNGLEATGIPRLRPNVSIINTVHLLEYGACVCILAIAIERYLSLRRIRKYLMRREIVFLGTDNKDSAEYFIGRIRILYSNPDDYSLSNHLKLQLGDKNYRNIIIGTALVACIIIIVSYYC
jgi:hypothetical protein